jgi:diguanylate cyclase (GGDEF)-like protein
MCDVDHFKRVNDAHGHAVGDRALCAVAEAIASQCRVTDLPCRYGGEEFATIAAGVSALGASRLAERCRQSVAETRLGEGPDAVCMTASFGVADARGASSPEALCSQADEALLRAKQNGRNRVELHQPG